MNNYLFIFRNKISDEYLICEISLTSLNTKIFLKARASGINERQPYRSFRSNPVKEFLYIFTERFF